MVKNFMFGLEWIAGCIGRSLEMDHYDGVIPHLAQRDVAYVVVSRAPLDKLLPFKKRMGWVAFE